MQKLSDGQLVTLALNGRQEAFEVLVERYQKQVFALAYRLGGDYDEARDMAQEVFIRIYQELPKFDNSRRFFPWMYRVAHNTCINILHKRPKEAVPLDSIYDLAAEGAANGSSPVASYEQLELADTLEGALRQLPESYRLPLVLKYVGGFSYQEIAEQMDLPVSTIETRLFRGRTMLKKALAGKIND